MNLLKGLPEITTVWKAAVQRGGLFIGGRITSDLAKMGPLGGFPTL